MVDDRVYKIDPETSEKVDFLNPSGGSNGLSFDLQGNLIICQNDERTLARLEQDGSVTVLASQYDGKKFNSPNDLTVRSDGSIFFTDPFFGWASPSPREMSYNGIFCLKSTGELVLLDQSISTPNGICLSPDEKKLYVNDTFSLTIYVYDIGGDWTNLNKSVFAQMTGSGYADGMKADQNGLVCSTGPGGIWIFSPDGELVDKISVPSDASNLNWGDADYQTLYITTWNNVYKIRLNTKGLVSKVEQEAVSLVNGFELQQNYPNPFNPSTTIDFTLPVDADINLAVYDLLGRRVDLLLEKRLTSGQHSITFDASHLTSGVYFYRLQAGEHVEMRKMMLVK